MISIKIKNNHAFYDNDYDSEKTEDSKDSEEGFDIL